MSSEQPRKRPRYVPAIGPRLMPLLQVVFALFALLSVNAVYLGSVTLLEWATGETYQNYGYQLMFLGHLVLGLIFAPAFFLFSGLHIKNAHGRPNRRAVRAGYGLFASGLVLIVSGVVLTRLEGFEVRDPATRSIAYWAHVISPFVAAWLFVLHRLAGKPIKWKVGYTWAGVAAVTAIPLLVLHAQEPKNWNVAGPESGEQYFMPALARTSNGNFIPAESMMMSDYCLECHEDAHASWEYSAHHLASFNNPAYLASIRETREVMMERDGNVQGARFCAGCHDPVPFFSGAFDDPDFDMEGHPTSQAGITCTACHAITNVNSQRGNGDYTIEEPQHYPFTFSDNKALRWINRQLVKAKPAFHKKTFLKDLHKTPEYCSACHKVFLPVEVNDYKWLRGQNSYDSFLLSGVSGHGASSFYYPPQAEENCNNCHMPLVASEDFGARDFDGTGGRKIHDHLFPSANTAIPHMVGGPPEVTARHEEFNEGVMRVDLFGLREGGRIDGELTAPLRPEVPTLEPGRRYLLDVVIRTVKMGHMFTEGTGDSNEIWLDVTLRAGERVVGRSGGRAHDGNVDPWSHFVNSFVIDRNGNRIDRRNPQDIFVPLYSHQIPPGAADVIHYGFDVPADIDPAAYGNALTVDVALRYRKFDTTYLKFIEGDAFDGNDLPVMTLATDTLTLPVGAASAMQQPAPDFPLWQRWNDYGIGLFRKGNTGANRGELRQAEVAFNEVERLGRPDGPVNLARVYFKEGRLDDAALALGRAAEFDPPAPAWTLAWFSGLVDKQNGYLDEAIANFREVLSMDSAETRERGFDFSLDYRVVNELAQTLLERGKQERGDARQDAREALLNEAVELYATTLKLDPENLAAHYNLALIHRLLGNEELAAKHQATHEQYRPDDNARDRAIALARERYPAADHAAEAIVIYDLQRAGAFELENR